MDEGLIAGTKKRVLYPALTCILNKKVTITGLGASGSKTIAALAPQKKKNIKMDIRKNTKVLYIFNEFCVLIFTHVVHKIRKSYFSFRFF